MNDNKMDNSIFNIEEPVFVGHAGLYEQFFDHIDVHVELNKEGPRPTLRESLAFFNKEILERLNRDERFLKYGVPIERLELWELISGSDHRVLDFSFKINEMNVKKVKFVFFDPDGVKKRSFLNDSRKRVMPPSSEFIIEPFGEDMLIAEEVRNAVIEELESLSLQRRDPRWKRERENFYYRVIDLCDPAINWDTFKEFKESERMKFDTICILAVQCSGGRIPETALERILKVRGRCTPTIVCLVSGDGPKNCTKHADAAWSRKYAEMILGLTRKIWNNGLFVIAACAIDTRQEILYEYGAEKPVKANKTNIMSFGKRVVRRIWEEIDVPTIC